MFTNDGLVGDYSLFLQSWTTPSGGIHGYLTRFLESGDPTFQHIAIWTLLQLLESNDAKLVEKINSSQDIMTMVRDISEKQIDSDDDVDDDDDTSGDGEGEVVALAKRCLELTQTAVVGGTTPRAASTGSGNAAPGATNGDAGGRTLSEG